METVYRCCCGLDVHKQTVAACVRSLVGTGVVRQEVRTFGTMTRDLLALADWLVSCQVTHVAMESTGVFWKPVYNILESHFQLLLVNARHIKQVPGRKTDVKDCEWIAQLLQHGLLRGSFVPERPQRELRDLTRHRLQLVNEQTRVANRVHKVLEDANVKLGSVASDVLGASGRAMLCALIAGQDDPRQLADLARGRLRSKIPQLQTALQGHLTSHHRFMLDALLKHFQFLEASVEQLSARIAEVMRPFAEALVQLQEIPGIHQRTAENILAEIGGDMSRFPTADHLSSWAGIAPGNDVSAGKRKSGRTTQGDHWLRASLVQAAWAASHAKNSYLAAQYRRLVGRRGKKRALVAVAHTLLVIIYHMLQRGTPYNDLGADYLDKLRPDHARRYHVSRLEKLGYAVTLKPTNNAA